jgi:hypothetical protein
MRTKLRQEVEQFISAAVFQPRPAAPKRLEPFPALVLSVINQEVSGYEAAFFT